MSAPRGGSRGGRAACGLQALVDREEGPFRDGIPLSDSERVRESEALGREAAGENARSPMSKPSAISAS